MSQVHTPRRSTKALALAIAAWVAAVASPVPSEAQVSGELVVQGGDSGWLYDLGDVISIFVEAPLEQPEPVAIGWAPPPMLVEDIPPQPTPDAVWTGGYWTWQGEWVWSAGRWLVPPRPRYGWVQPYYEHRDERVIFVPGYWSRPDAEFVAPAYDRPIPWAFVGVNVTVGPPPMGPAGIFIPPPPESRPGIIIPAPVGTPPAVVVSAPPVMQIGMRVRNNVTVDHTVINDNRVTNYNVTNVRNVTNVVIEAPAAATANGRTFQATVPHQAHLAAAQKPVVAVRAPMPASRAPVQAYVLGRPAPTLPPPQKVAGLPAVPPHPVAALTAAQRNQLAHPPIVPQPHGSTPTAAAQTRPDARPPAQLAAPSSSGAKEPQPGHPGAIDKPAAQAKGEPPAPLPANAEAQSRQRAQQQAEHAHANSAEQQQQQQQQQQAQVLARERAQAQALAKEQSQQRDQQQRQRAAEEQARQQERQKAQQQVQREREQAAARAAQAQQQHAQAEAQAREREQQMAHERARQEQHAQKTEREPAGPAQRKVHPRPHAEENRRASRPHD